MPHGNPPIYAETVKALGYDPLYWHHEYEYYRQRWVIGMYAMPVIQRPTDIVKVTLI